MNKYSVLTTVDREVIAIIKNYSSTGMLEDSIKSAVADARYANEDDVHITERSIRTINSVEYKTYAIKWTESWNDENDKIVYGDTGEDEFSLIDVQDY